MPTVASLPDDDALRNQFGPATFARAQQYVEQGHVIECAYQFDGDGDLDIRGRVRGTTAEEYAAFLSAGVGADGHWVYTRCSCPVADQCKHALALLLTVIEQEAAKGEDADTAGRGWERQLDLVLDELDADAEVRAAAHKPLALLVDIARPAPPKKRWAPAATGRGQLRIRPLQRGSRGSWVRSGVSWQALSLLERRGEFEPEQAAALVGLLAAHQSSQRHGYLGAEPYLRLQAFGPALWPALEHAVVAGVDLVPAESLGSVTVLDEPVGLQLDVSAVDAQTRLQVGVDVGGHWYTSDAIELLGEQSHGVALWRAGDTPYAAHVVLAQLDRPAGPQVRRLLAGAQHLVVPETERADLVAGYLPRLQRHLAVGSADGTVTVPEAVHPRLVLSVHWVAVDQVSLTWTFRYLVGSDDRVYGLTEARGLRAGVRRPTDERALLDALQLDDVQRELLCRSHRDDDDPVEQQTLTGMDAVAFAEDVLPGLETAERVEIEEIGGRPRYHEATSAPVIHFAARADAPPVPGDTELVDDRTDWLDLEVVITVDGTPLALSALLEALTVGKRRMVLGNGSHVSLDRPEFQHLAELVESAAELQVQPDDGVRVSHHDLGLWEELAEIGVVDAQADQWVRAAQALRDIESLPEVAEPRGVTATLRHYQSDGFRWLAFLWEAGLGGILGDDMGLGKTLQTLALVAHARTRGSDPFLVVAPTSVLSTWVNEAATFTPGLQVRAVTESQARRGCTIEQVRDGADVVVTSYTLYRLEADAYVGQQWGGLVLDEAQAVKNHLSKTYQAVRRLDAPFRLAITGTPMENRLMELWSLLSIVAPGLYAYPEQFTELVAVPVEKLGDTDALDRFRRRIRPFLLRRTKDLVAADLPPKQEQVLEVQLTPRHRRLYETHLQRERQHVLGLVEDFDKHRIAIFRSLTKLRQLSLDAALVDDAYDGVGSAKLDALVDHLHEVLAEGHRALVFSQFTSFLTRARHRLDTEGIASTYLDGRTRRRAEVVDEFKRGDAGVFLISLKAGGVGLTLTEADYVFVLDPWWNPAVEAQAVDRAHRIGQDKPVMVYRLVSSGTIEEKVMELKDRKAALFAKVLDGDGAMSAPLTAGDVRALFAD